MTHFQFLHHFGRPHCRMVCNCRYEKLSRMSVCEVLYCGVIYESWIWDAERRRGNLVPVLAYSFRKAPRRSPDLTSSSNGWITITVYMPSYHMHFGRNCDLTQVYLEQNLPIKVLLHHPSKSQREIISLDSYLALWHVADW